MIHSAEKNGPLTFLKPASQFVSPRSITEFSNLTKMLNEAKRHTDDVGGESEIVRIKEQLRLTTRRIEEASSSLGFSLNGQGILHLNHKKSQCTHYNHVIEMDDS